MKEYLLALIFVCLSFVVIAQITVTNSIFPVEGDTLTTVVVTNPAGIMNSAAGPNQVWNYQNLDGSLPMQQIFQDADSGIQSTSFPNADLFVETAVFGERYFQSSNNAFSVLGFAGGDPSGFGLDLVAVFDQPYVQQRAPLTYAPDIIQTASTSYGFRFAMDDLPSVITDSLTDLPFTLDSIGIKIVLNRMDKVDAWGTMHLPGGSYEVLREAREEIVDTRIEAKLPFFGWTDITSQIPVGFGAGTDTTYSFGFYNDVEKEPIALIVTEDDQSTILNIEYNYNEVTSNAENLLTATPGFFAFPNPAILDVNLQLINLATDRYTFKMFNILGMKVLEKTLETDRITSKINIDLRSFKKGTYLYSLTNSKGKILGTKRLMIIRP